MSLDLQETAARQEWEVELRFYQAHEAEFAGDARYRGRYLALSAGKVVDSDPNKFALAERVAEHFADAVVLIAKPGANREVDLPSPEVG